MSRNKMLVIMVLDEDDARLGDAIAGVGFSCKDTAASACRRFVLFLGDEEERGELQTRVIKKARGE